MGYITLMFGIVPLYRLKKRFFLLLFLYVIISGGFNFIRAQSLQDQAKVQYYLSRIEDEQFTYQQKIAFYDSILSYYHNAGNHSMDRIYAFEKMNLYYDNESYLEAYRIGVDLMKEINSNTGLTSQDSLQKNFTHLIIGKCCRYLGMYDESISHLYSIIQQPFNRYTIEAYSYLGFAFMQMRQMENSKIYNEKALELLFGADSSLAQKTSSIIYNNMAGYYYTANQLDSAVYYLNLSIEHYDNAENVISKSYIHHNMAVIYQQMGENLMAKDYYYKAIEASLHEPYKLALYKQNLAFLFLEENKLDEAEKLYFEALDAAESIDSKKRIGSVYIELSDLYCKKHQFEKAFTYLQEGVALRDSISHANNMEKIMLLTKDFEQRERKMEHDLLKRELLVTELENKNKMIILIVLFSILIICTALLIYTLKKLKKQKKNNLALNQEIHSIQHNTEKIVQSSIEQLNKDIDYKNRELATFTLMTVKTNEIFHVLKNEVKKLKYPDLYKNTKSIVEKIESTLNSYDVNQGWDEFKLYFEKVHPSFFIKLYEACPRLTQTEQRTCALIAINLSTKEIADLTYRSTRTVEAVIYQVRKKLNIPNEEKTAAYLQQYLLD